MKGEHARVSKQDKCKASSAPVIVTTPGCFFYLPRQSFLTSDIAHTHRNHSIVFIVAVQIISSRLLFLSHRGERILIVLFDPLQVYLNKPRTEWHW